MSTEGFTEREQEIKQIKANYPLLYPISLALVFLVIGLWLGSLIFRGEPGYGTNIYTEGLSIFVTVFILNLLAEKREERRFKADLVSKMGSRINHEAIRAIEEVRRHGWLFDGSLKGIEFSRADMQDADFSRHFVRLGREAHLGDLPNLEEITFSSSNLQRAKFWGAMLKGAKFMFTDLQAATLASSNLRDALFLEVNLTNAELHVADLENARLWDTKLHGANLNGANLQNAHLQFINLNSHVIFKAEFDENTVLPDGEKWSSTTDMGRFTDPNHPEFWRSEDVFSPASDPKMREIRLRELKQEWELNL